MKLKNYFLGIVLFLPILCAAQQSIMGTDFWIGFIDQFDNTVSYQVWISSDVGATGTVSVPGIPWSTPFTVAANATSIVTIPSANVWLGNSETINHKAVHVNSDNNISIIATTHTSVRTESS